MSVLYVSRTLRPVMSVVVSDKKAMPDFSFSGIVKAGDDRKLVFKHSGRIQRIVAKKAQHVKKGDKIAWLIPDDFQNRLVDAEAIVKRDRLTYERVKNAADRNAVSQEELSKAEANLKRSESQYQLAKTALDETVLYAPFDGVIADGSCEAVFKGRGLEGFNQMETERAAIPHSPGPLAELFRKLAALRDLEFDRQSKEPGYRRRLSLSIVTARGVPSHERVVTTLREWGITIDKTFFLGGMNKGRILASLRPHIFFDDQIHPHLDAAAEFTPSVHVPFAGTCD